MQRASRLVLSIVLSLSSTVHAIDITACDQEVPAGELGMLTTDLDCTWDTEPESYGVELQRGAKLDLQGHTITGPQWAVYCPGPGTCNVVSTGPAGTLTGAEAGIWTPNSKVVVSNVRLTGNDYGISNNPKTTLTDVTFDGNGFALTSRSLRATNLTVTGSCAAGYCLDLGKGRIDGLVTSDTGPSATVIQATRSIKLSGASMSGAPGQAGIYGSSIRILDSVVTGHGIDLASRSLRARNTTCEHSRRFGRDGFVIGTWGVCSGD